MTTREERAAAILREETDAQTWICPEWAAAVRAMVRYADEEKAAPVNELRLCASAHLALRPGELYRFFADENCAECCAMRDAASPSAQREHEQKPEGETDASGPSPAATSVSGSPASPALDREALVDRIHKFRVSRGWASSWEGDAADFILLVTAELVRERDEARRQTRAALHLRRQDAEQLGAEIDGLRSAVQAARAEEREACARVCEKMYRRGDSRWTNDELRAWTEAAAEIRSRSRAPAQPSAEERMAQWLLDPAQPSAPLTRTVRMEDGSLAEIGTSAGGPSAMEIIRSGVMPRMPGSAPAQPRATEPTPVNEETLRDLGQRWLDAGKPYADLARKLGAGGAVIWLQATDGTLMIHTRGEYREVLMANVDKIKGVREIQFTPSAPPAPTDAEVRGAVNEAWFRNGKSNGLEAAWRIAREGRSSIFKDGTKEARDACSWVEESIDFEIRRLRTAPAEEPKAKNEQPPAAIGASPIRTERYAVKSEESSAVSQATDRNTGDGSNPSAGGHPAPPAASEQDDFERVAREYWKAPYRAGQGVSQLASGLRASFGECVEALEQIRAQRSGSNDEAIRLADAALASMRARKEQGA